MGKDCLKNIDVVVLAGGLGTRISPVLKNTPKILAPIGGRPYIDFLISWLQSFGARRIVFGLGHLAGAVADYLHDNPVDGIKFEVAVEEKPLGTGGAITHVRSKIKSDPVLVMNGDSFVDADLCKFVAQHISSNTEASLLCTQVDDASRYGTITLDGENHVLAFREKTDGIGAGIINAGIYLFCPAILEEIAESGPSLESDFFQVQPAGRLTAMSGEFTFLDIGTPEDLARASDVLGKFYN
jgi:NDP-sugar pyrophosphorylase family protein